MRCMSFALLGALATWPWSAAPALEPVPADTPGTLTLDFAWKAREEVRGISPGHRITDRRATVRCALVAGSVASQSVLDGPDAEQSAAMAELESTTRADLEAIRDDSAAGMQAMAARMADCRKRGRSEQECAMAMVAAMQSDPALLAAMSGGDGRDGRARGAAEARVMAAASRIQPWYLEGCRGTMTVADVSALDDPTTPGIDPPVHTTGTVAFEPGEHLMLIETDLARGVTNMLLNAPRASGFVRGGMDRVDAVAMPVDQVRIGPRPGPLGSGRHEFPVTGGSASVAWRFERGR
jgi:hypothetical protein